MRPLHLLPAALGAASGGLAVEVEVRNDCEAALSGWTLAVVYAGERSGGVGGDGGSAVVRSCPLPSLASGSAWHQPFHLDADWTGGGWLLVLLCYKGVSVSDVSTSPEASAGAAAAAEKEESGGCAALLHSVRLDALHFMHGGSQAACGSSSAATPAAAHPPELPLAARLLLHLPRRGLGHPSPAAVLSQLLDRGLSTQPAAPDAPWVASGPPPLALANAFSLVVQPGTAGQAAAAGRVAAGGACSAARQGSLDLGRGLDCQPVSLQAAQQRGGTAGGALLELSVAAASPAALLAAHRGLLERLLGWQQGQQGGGGQAQQQQLGIAVPGSGGRLLVPPPGSTGLAAVADEAALEAALLQLRAARRQAFALRDAAFAAREVELAGDGAAAAGDGAAAAAEQRARRERARQLVELALAARAALGAVPVAVP